MRGVGEKRRRGSSGALVGQVVVLVVDAARCQISYREQVVVSLAGYGGKTGARQFATLLLSLMF